jgi:hypothetical protein
MKTFGKVEAIINSQLVLISSSHTLAPKETVQIFSILDDSKLRELGFSEPILYPKGELRVICQQPNNMYLAERFREIQKRVRKVVSPSPITQQLSGILASFQPETKEIVEEIAGPWSGELNESQSLNLPLSSTISIGDLVGRLP